MVYTIREEVTYEVTADSAQEAIDQFLSADDPNAYFKAVQEREVVDDEGFPQVVTDRR